MVSSPRWKRHPLLAILDKLAKPLARHRKVFTDALYLSRFLAQFGPFDVIEAQCEEPDGLVVAMLSVFQKLPPWCVQLFALRYRFEAGKPIFEQRTVLGFVFRRAALVKANSGLVAECLQRFYDCAKEKIVVVPPNTEAPSVPPTPRSGSRRVLCVSAAAETKGVREFLQAAQILAACHPEIKFELVGGNTGTPEYSREIDHLARELGGRLERCGQVSRNQLHAEILKADLVVIPSLFDAWNRAAIESISLGRPLVISDRCGAASWVKEQSAGVVVAPEPPELAAAILKALEDEELAANALRASGKAREEFNASNVASQSLIAMEKLLP